MARKNIMDRLDEVAKSTEVQGQIVEIINIPEKNLVDYPNNNEDVSYTEDLEKSMENNGFTDPLEVTDFEMKSGQYMILSGHRRRAAARKKGYPVLPCIIRHFGSNKEMEDYILMSNAHRNTESDPLLYCKRYKLHEDFLKRNEYKGSIRDEIAKRLGISVQQIDRYRQMNKIIMPVWDMIRNGQVGMSSILFMATYSVEQQQDIYNILVDNINKGVRLSREKCALIKDLYDKKDDTLEEPEPATMIVKEESKAVEVTSENKRTEEKKPVTVSPVQSSTNIAEDKPAIKTKVEEQEDLLPYLEKMDEYLTCKMNVTSQDQGAKIVKKLEIIVIDALEEINRICKSTNMSGNGNIILKSISKHLDTCMKDIR